MRPDKDYPIFTLYDEMGDILSLHISPEAFEDDIPKEDFLKISKFLAGSIADVIFSEGEEGMRKIKLFPAPTSNDWKDLNFNLS